MSPGRCFGLGVGPGDPDLITVKALRLLQACPVVASLSAKGRPSNARNVVAGHLASRTCVELHFEYPVTVETLPDDVSYEALLTTFYDESAAVIATHLVAGRDVAVLCEGDPFFFGSFMYLHTRLQSRFSVEVVPGVPSALAAAAAIGIPLVSRNETFTTLSGVLDSAALEHELRTTDAAVIMKLGRNLAKVRDAITRAGLLERAMYVERATTAQQHVLRLADVDADTAPYFSIVVIPGLGARTR